MDILRKFNRFYKTHIWFQVSCIFGTAILVITIVFLFYVRNSYTNFLLEKNHLMGAAVLETMRMNLDQSLHEYIDMGAQIAVDPDVYELSESLISGDLDSTSGLFKIRLKFSKMASYSKNILSIALFTRSGDLYQYDRTQKVTENLWIPLSHSEYLNLMYEDIYTLANKDTLPRYIVSTQQDTHPAAKERFFHIFYPVVGKENNFSKTNSVLCVTYSMDILQPLLKVISKENSPYSEGYLTDSSGIIIYHSDDSFIGKPEETYLNSSELYIMDHSLGKIKWKIHISLNKTKLDHSVAQITNQGMVVYALLLIGLILVFYLIIRKINGILNKMQKAMNITGSGEKRKKVSIRGGHEIWQLANGYNDMLEKLAIQEDEVEKNYQLSLIALERQHQAERETLETQINAHFICNTLGTINYEAMESGNHKLSLQIKTLSNILRYTFDQSCQHVLLYQEISWINQYLYLQKTRLEDVFNYSIEFPNECDFWPCCKLMLQPFVENAIIHGFEGRESGGVLSIAAYLNGERLSLMIRDNGCGIAQEKKIIIQEVLAGERLKATTDIGIGIQNAASRMRLFYGSSLEMKLRSTKGEGTEFEFLLPLPTRNTKP